MFKLNRVHWSFKSKVDYLIVNYTDIREDFLAIEVAKKAYSMTKNLPDKSIRALILVKGGKISPKAMREIMVYGKESQVRVKKSAIVGVVGMASLLMRIYVSYTGSNVRFFTNEKDALKYVLSD